MFKIVDLSENDKETSLNSTDEAENYGGPTEGHIKFNALLDWMRNVHANQNAKYLKCLDWRTNRIDVNNIVDVLCSENVVHKTETFDRAVKIAFKQESSAPAMTIEDAANLFEAIASKCEEDGVDLGTVEVFVMNENEKLTYFSWYYDEGTDTAVVIKNMSPRKAAEFLKNGAEAVLTKAATTNDSKTMENLTNELQKIQDQMNKLKAKQDAVYNKMEQVSLNEQDESEEEKEEKEEKAKKAKKK